MFFVKPMSKLSKNYRNLSITRPTVLTSTPIPFKNGVTLQEQPTSKAMTLKRKAVNDYHNTYIYN